MRKEKEERERKNPDQAGAASAEYGSNSCQHKEKLSLSFSAPLISELQPATPSFIIHAATEEERKRGGRCESKRPEMVPISPGLNATE